MEDDAGLGNGGLGRLAGMEPRQVVWNWDTVYSRYMRQVVWNWDTVYSRYMRHVVWNGDMVH